MALLIAEAEKRIDTYYAVVVAVRDEEPVVEDINLQFTRKFQR